MCSASLLLLDASRSSMYPMLRRGRLRSRVFEPSRKPVWKMGFLEEELLGKKASVFLL